MKHGRQGHGDTDRESLALPLMQVTYRQRLSKWQLNGGGWCRWRAEKYLPPGSAVDYSLQLCAPLIQANDGCNVSHFISRVENRVSYRVQIILVLSSTISFAHADPQAKLDSCLVHWIKTCFNHEPNHTLT